MSPALKSALLSGLLFPGLGQIYLKHYKRGFTFAIITVGILYPLTLKVLEALQLIMPIVINSNFENIDPSALQNKIELFFKNQNIIFYQFLEFAFLICWVSSIVDAYQLGSKIEQTPEKPKKAVKNKGMAIKSALLSGLILPGLGQIYLKYYYRGCAYITVELICFYFILIKAIEIIQTIMSKSLHDLNDYFSIQTQLELAFANQNMFFYKYLEILLIIVWIISIIDAYYLGLKKEASTTPPDITNNSEILAPPK